MFKRTFISAGDTTTSGGRVEPNPQACAITFDGRLAGLEGDPVWCPVCKTFGVAKCVMPFIPDVAPNGAQKLLDGDLCMCQCPVPPRLIGELTHYWFGLESHHVEKMGSACAGWITHMGLQAQFPALMQSRHGKRFQFNHSETGEPLAGRTVIVEEGGSIREMKTDVQGGLTIMSAAGSSIKLHVVFESSLGELTYGIGND